jgi:hypothetical protein
MAYQESFRDSYLIKKDQLSEEIVLVDDKHGSGWFSIEMNFGDSRFPLPVYAVDSNQQRIKAFLDYQREMEFPILAFRFSPDGVCGIQVNSEVVEVKEMKRHQSDASGRGEVRDFYKDEVYEERYIAPKIDSEGIPHFIFIKGELKDEGNRGFEAKISFVPSDGGWD